MRTVYIVLTDTGTMLSNVIKKVTNSPYNHASISLDDSLINCYSFGRKSPYNPFDGGFVREDVKNGTYAWFPETTCRIYKLIVDKKTYNKIRKNIREFEENERNYRYSLLGLMGILLDRPITWRNGYFCSYFVASILSRSGIKLLDKHDALVRPEDFLNIESLEMIYEGYLYDYEGVKKRIISDPRNYQSFPFFTYIKGRIYRDSDNNLSFIQDFIRPKKVYVDKTFNRMIKIKHL